MLDKFRKGKIQIGNAILDNIDGFIPQKNLIKSQVSFFEEEHELAMRYAEKALPHDDQWYAGNVLCEHFFAYTYSAIQTDRVPEAKDFYSNYLKQKLKQDLPQHRVNFYAHQVSQHLKKLEGDKQLAIHTRKPYRIIYDGEPIQSFYDRYRVVHSKSDLKSKDAIGYIFHFMLEYGNTDICLDFYEENWELLIQEDAHLRVAQAYTAKQQIQKAQLTILRFAERFWLPVDNVQIVPMKLFEFEDLLKVMDKELKRTILHADKTRH